MQQHACRSKNQQRSVDVVASCAQLCCVACAVSAGVLFFIQLLPVTICCFEYYKWQQLVSA